MAVTAKAYGLAQQSLVSGQIAFVTQSIRCVLLTSGYVPSQDTHRYRSDLTSEVVDGGGYTTGGKALSGKAVAYDAATNVLKLTASPLSWDNSTITARYAVFFAQVGADLATPADDPLLCYWDLGADVSSVTGPFNLNISAAGLLTLTAA